jgi:hypothetical protein
VRWFARRRYGVLAFAAALVVAGATTLFLAPWASSPGFLERAQAALTPSAGSILHYKWQETRSSTQFSCTVTERRSEIWIDQTYPRKYRALFGHEPATRDEQVVVLVGRGPATSDGARKQICSRGKPAEIGGDLTERPTLMFFPPDWLSYAPRVTSRSSTCREPPPTSHLPTSWRNTRTQAGRSRRLPAADHRRPRP